MRAGWQLAGPGEVAGQAAVALYHDERAESNGPGHAFHATGRIRVLHQLGRTWRAEEGDPVPDFFAAQAAPPFGGQRGGDGGVDRGEVHLQLAGGRVGVQVDRWDRQAAPPVTRTRSEPDRKLGAEVGRIDRRWPGTLTHRRSPPDADSVPAAPPTPRPPGRRAVRRGRRGRSVPGRWPVPGRSPRPT